MTWFLEFFRVSVWQQFDLWRQVAPPIVDGSAGPVSRAWRLAVLASSLAGSVAGFAVGVLFPAYLLASLVAYAVIRVLT